MKSSPSSDEEGTGIEIDLSNVAPEPAVPAEVFGPGEMRHKLDFSENLSMMKIGDLIPYWRNPRRVTDEAVNQLAESIRQYGYQQPIVVDENDVIIVGHTRYIALQRLGVTEVPVLKSTSLSPEEVKQLRIIDNRVAEYTTWDLDKLMTELAAIDNGQAVAYFPDLVGDVMDEVAAQQAYEDDKWSKVDNSVEFTCPLCFHSWEMKVTRDALLGGLLKVEDMVAE